MGSSSVVVLDPSGQGRAAGSVGGPGAGVGEFGEQCAVEPFGFAVGPGASGLDEPPGDGQVGAGQGPVGASAVDQRVVGQDPLDDHAVAGEPGCGSAQERRCGRVGLVGQRFDVGQAGVVVDGDVQVVEAAG